MEDGRTRLRLMKERCQAGYQQGVAAQARRTRRSSALTDSAGETGSGVQRETRDHGTHKTAGSNPRCGAV